MVWLTGGALALAVLMIVGLVFVVVAQGLPTFWPQPLPRVETVDGRVYLGEIKETELYVPSETQIANLPAEVAEETRATLAEQEGQAQRDQIRVGNYELTGEHFRWLSELEIAARENPEWAVVVERVDWGRFYGIPAAFILDGEEQAVGDPEGAWKLFEEHHEGSRERFEKIRYLDEREGGAANESQEAARRAVRGAEIKSGEDSEEAVRAREELARVQAETETELARIAQETAALRTENGRYALRFDTADGQGKTMPLEDIVRAYPANRLSFAGKLRVYLSRWWEFLSDPPRYQNSEGGVAPAIFGTVLMTMIMSLLVVPFGVLAALYLREYAKQGFIVSAVRVAVNNLAGVPSIVFGVFGLGFFCYLIGGWVDETFFFAKLPSPTFGTGGLMWAAFTLALLTLPVVIVATEEALSAVPSSMREGSYACGATKWQTIRRIVLPRAAPGIMTGMILAIARGAGEVAPLMLVGVMKIAPEPLIDVHDFPYLHAERSFMHLGFHIYDLGFQSPNSEAAIPMVFTTTLLLIGIVVLLNVAAIAIRSRLRRRFAGTHI
ncbi:MAG: phosphate ABC transporter permease PstA [Planctomycetota bacterium]